MSDSATAVNTKLISLYISSEGKFDDGEGLDINERFRIQIVHDPEGENQGSYMIEGTKQFSGLVTDIKMEGDLINSFQLEGPLGEKRVCRLKGLTGQLKGGYFDPRSGLIKPMTATCSATILSSEEGRIAKTNIALKGAVSHEDAEALALLSGLGVNLILQAFNIPHPEDEALVARIGAGEMSPEELKRVAIFGGKGPLVADMAVRVICERLLRSHAVRVEYHIVKDEE